MTMVTNPVIIAPALANGALLLALGGCTQTYIEALNSLYSDNSLPCPDLSYLTRHSKVTTADIPCQTDDYDIDIDDDLARLENIVNHYDLDEEVVYNEENHTGGNADVSHCSGFNKSFYSLLWPSDEPSCNVQDWFDEDPSVLEEPEEALITDKELRSAQPDKGNVLNTIPVSSYDYNNKRDKKTPERQMMKYKSSPSINSNASYIDDQELHISTEYPSPRSYLIKPSLATNNGKDISKSTLNKTPERTSSRFTSFKSSPSLSISMMTEDNQVFHISTEFPTPRLYVVSPTLNRRVRPAVPPKPPRLFTRNPIARETPPSIHYARRRANSSATLLRPKPKFLNQSKTLSKVFQPEPILRQTMSADNILDMFNNITSDTNLVYEADHCKPKKIYKRNTTGKKLFKSFRSKMNVPLRRLSSLRH